MVSSLNALWPRGSRFVLAKLCRLPERARSIPLRRRLRDDRERVCELAKPAERFKATPLRRAAGVEFRWCDWRQFFVALVPSIMGFALGILLARLSIVLLQHLSPAMLPRNTLAQALIGLASLTVPFGCSVRLGVGVAKVLLRRHRVRTRLRVRLCASCCYALAGLKPGEDGCTLCPECGAAWRVPELTRAQEIAKYPWWWRRFRAWRDDRGAAVHVDREWSDLLRASRLRTKMGLTILWITGFAYVAGRTPLQAWLTDRLAANRGAIWYRWPVEDILGSLIGVAIAWGIIAFARPGRANRIVIAHRTARGRCGACDRDLADVSVKSDGCKACPACGAAWRLPGAPTKGTG